MKKQGKSFEAACEWLKEKTGDDYSKLPIVDHIPGGLGKALVSIYKLWVIAKALREGEKLTKGFIPWFWLDRAGSGSGFAFGAGCGSGYSNVGARLEYPDGDTAREAAELHKDLYRDVMVEGEVENG